MQSERNIATIQNNVTKELILNLLYDHFCKNYNSDDVNSALNSIFNNINNLEVIPSDTDVINKHEEDSSNDDTEIPPVNKLNKNDILKILKQNDITIEDKFTLASKNSMGNYYWMNPNKNVVEKDWALILNDYNKHLLYLFFIPKSSLQEDQLVLRKDKPDIIQILIEYDDDKFTDRRSKIKFNRWLKKTIKY